MLFRINVIKHVVALSRSLSALSSWIYKNVNNYSNYMRLSFSKIMLTALGHFLSEQQNKDD